MTNDRERSEWEKMTGEEKKRRLFLRQVKLLDTFLEKGAINRRQYDKSYGDLVIKMGMGEETKK